MSAPTTNPHNLTHSLTQSTLPGLRLKKINEIVLDKIGKCVILTFVVNKGLDVRRPRGLENILRGFLFFCRPSTRIIELTLAQGGGELA